MKANPRQCECGNHVWDGAARGFVVMVSPADAAHLSARVDIKRGKGAYHHARIKSGRQWIGLARLICAPPEGLEAFARNGNFADCRRENIMHATRKDIRAAAVTRRGTKAVARCVYRMPNGRFYAVIKRGRKTVYLGDHDTAEGAAALYQDAAAAVYGAFHRPPRARPRAVSARAPV